MRINLQGTGHPMCIICLEFQRNQDLAEARMMLDAARREPNSIDQAHLDQVEEKLDKAAAKANP